MTKWKNILLGCMGWRRRCTERGMYDGGGLLGEGGCVREFGGGSVGVRMCWRKCKNENALEDLLEEI